MIVTVVNMRMKVLPMTQVSGLVIPPPPPTFCLKSNQLQAKLDITQVYNADCNKFENSLLV